MKKKQFNEAIYRKLEAQRRRSARNYRREIRANGFFGSGNTSHMRQGLERHALLMSAGVVIFDRRPLPGMDTLFSEAEVSNDRRQAAASKRTIDFVRNPYKFNGYNRGDKLTHAERKQVVDNVMYYASVQSITISRRQIDQIIRRYCFYKPERSEPVDPFMERLRTERYHTQWVVDLGRLCLTYVQLGSDFPMWTYFKSGRKFTYRGIDYLAATVFYSSGVDALAQNVKQMGALEQGPYLRAPVGALDADSASRFVAPVNEGFLPGTHLDGIPNYSQTQVKSDLAMQALMKKTDDIIDKTNAATQDAFVDAAKADFRKIAIHGSLDCLAREEEVQPLTRLEQIQMNSLKHLEPRAKK